MVLLGWGGFAVWAHTRISDDAKQFHRLQERAEGADSLPDEQRQTLDSLLEVTEERAISDTMKASGMIVQSLFYVILFLACTAGILTSCGYLSEED